MKKTFSLSLFLGLFFALSTSTFAAPTISSQTTNSFPKKYTSSALSVITITDDQQTAVITADNDIRIHIPDGLKMIFDDEKTKSSIVLSGSAITNSKISKTATVTFEDKDKTLVIPVDQNFAAGESLTIFNVYVEGFTQVPIDQNHLELIYAKAQPAILDDKLTNITTSTFQDITKPETPTNLKLEQLSDSSLKITWTNPTDLDLILTKILRGLNHLPVSSTAYWSVGSEMEEYVDTGLKVGDKVKYQLVAEDGPNASNPTEIVEYTMVDYSTIEKEQSPKAPENPPAEEAVICTDEYAPVCGVDGKTYSNKCVAEQQNKVELASEGACEETPAEPDQDLPGEPPAPTEKPLTFTDTANHWAKDVIAKMATLKLVQGNPDGTFDPDGNLNRAQAGAFLYRTFTYLAADLVDKIKTTDPDTVEGNKALLGLLASIKVNVGAEPLKPTVKPFSDVGIEEWYSGYLDVLKNAKVAQGNPDGTYRPDKNINRAEFITLVMKLYYNTAADAQKAEFDSFKLSLATDSDLTANVKNAFGDLKAVWYLQNVNFAAHKGFIEGRNCGDYKCFEPQSNITRAEAVKILNHVFIKSGETEQ